MRNTVVNEEMFPNEKNTVLGPGKLLQIAREEKNLRPEDVAYEIRLTPSQVLALDEDDYSRMPEETYVRGYLRNYARLVGVPENDILMAFARMTRATDATPTAVNAPADSETGRNNRAGLLIAVISAAAIAILAAVLFIQPHEELPLADSRTDTAVVDEKPVIEEVPVGTSTLTLDEPAVDPDLTVSSISSANEPQVATEISASAEAMATLKLEVAAEEKTEKNIPEPDKTVDISEVAETKTATPASEQNASSGGVLLIHYSKDSWTDVRDASGKKLLYRTVKAGEQIALAGD
ncbi:MAG: DUF4115 domain-containing protein, partial [Pseudomonadota bacterium]|nr:DUF4115 domain-containing protein [Pseudomonadota bacterium]